MILCETELDVGTRNRRADANCARRESEEQRVPHACSSRTSPTFAVSRAEMKKGSTAPLLLSSCSVAWDTLSTIRHITCFAVVSWRESASVSSPVVLEPAANEGELHECGSKEGSRRYMAASLKSVKMLDHHRVVKEVVVPSAEMGCDPEMLTLRAGERKKSAKNN